MYANQCKILLTVVGIEITREPSAANVNETIPWVHIAGVFPEKFQEKQVADIDWSYRFDTITVIRICKVDGSYVDIELQEISNLYTWNLGTLDSLNHAITDINAQAFTGVLATNPITTSWLRKAFISGNVLPIQAKVDVYDAAFDYADTNSLTGDFDLVGLFKVPNVDLAKIPFVHSGGNKTFISVGAPTFTANKGLKSNGTGYIRTQWIEAVDAVNYKLNDGCSAVFTDYTVAESKVPFGSSDSSSAPKIIINAIYPKDATNNLLCFIQYDDDSAVGGTDDVAAIATPAGFSSVSIVGDDVVITKDGVSQAPSTMPGSPTTLSTVEEYALAMNTDGVATDFYTGDVSLIIKAKGTIDQIKLNTFATMLLT